MYIDTNAQIHEVKDEEIEKSKADRLGKTHFFLKRSSLY